MKRVPSILSVPLRALARRDFVEARVAIDIAPRRRDVAWIVAAFALTPAELGFARALLAQKPNLRLFRANQRASCGDFVVVDPSPPDVERRRVVVLDLKLGAALSEGGGGAGVQLMGARRAVAEVAQSFGLVHPDAPIDLLAGGEDVLLEALASRDLRIARRSRGPRARRAPSPGQIST